MMKKIICGFLVFIMCTLFQLTAFAAEDTKILPSGLAYSDLEETIDNYVDEHEATTAAVSVAIFYGDEVWMEKAYGYTDILNGTANDSDAVFEWGSCTKLLTWVSVMQLVENGVIDLNEDIRTYLPADFFTKLSYDAPITMLNLMNHNAGWQETVTDLFIEDKGEIKDLEDALQYIEPEQVNKPGTVVAYSNWGAALAGYIVECVSGQPFDEYVHENIFAPLGMEHTAISSDLSDNDWVSQKRGEEKCYTTNNELLGTSLYYLSLYPAGMATGTMSDFVKFAQAVSQVDSKTSLLFNKADTLGLMLSPSLYYADGKTARNCHGFWTDEFGVPVLWHNGGTVGSSSWFAFDTETGTGMVVLTNQSGETVYNYGLLPLVFGKDMKEKSADSSAADISGVYVSSRSCFRGFAKLYSLFSIMQLTQNGESGYTVQGTDFTITNIGKNKYQMVQGTMKQRVYTNIDEEGRKILQMLGSDYIEVNGYIVIAKYLLLLLFAIAALCSFLMLISDAINFAKRKKPCLVGKCCTVVNISVIAAILIFAYMAVSLFTSDAALFTSIQWCLIVNVVLALIPILYAVLLIMKWKGLDCTRAKKVKLIISGVMGFIMTFNIILWEAYKFW